MRIPVNRIGRCSRLGCQAWGGPRASNNKWSNEAGSIATNDHRKCWEAEIGGTTVGDAGVTSALAKLMLAQTGQNTSAGPVGLFGGTGVGLSADALPMSAATTKACEIPTDMPRWTWPNANTSWHASANTASHATLYWFDLNQPIALQP
jgi:hypothetical protein